MIDKWQRLTSKQQLSIIIFLAFFMRLFVLFQETYISRDATLYMKIGFLINQEGFSEGIKLCSWLPPLFPLICSVPYKMGLPPEKTLQVFFIAINSLAIIPVYLLSYKIFNKDTAIICALLMSLHPELIETSFAINREAIYFPSMLTAIYFAYRSFEDLTFRNIFFTGVLGGIAYTSRQEALEIFVAMAFMLTFCLLSKKRKIKPIIKVSVLSFSVFALTLVPFYFLVQDTHSIWDPLATKRTKSFLYDAGILDRPEPSR